MDGRAYVEVLSVRPGSSADLAAIAVGTRVLGVDGHAVQSLDQFHAHVARRLPGDTIVLHVLRPHTDDHEPSRADSAVAKTSDLVQLVVGASSVSATHVAALWSAAAPLTQARLVCAAAQRRVVTEASLEEQTRSIGAGRSAATTSYTRREPN